ncbi:LCP family protein, partial [Candidatus Gracilibacteria bacterium]|nr:LCP family protein [Candidatus Gracilibacteria bacterium]
MNFRVHKIRNRRRPSRDFKQFLSKKVLRIILGVGVLIAVFGAGVWAVKSGVFGSAPQKILSLTPLETDNNGHTNILLLGVAGTTEEGGHLTDSMMIVSVNPDRPSVSILSLPRDLYLSSNIGEHKINAIYALARAKHGEGKSLEIVKRAISSFTGVDIHYAAVVDFALFEEGINLLGGVEVFVPQDIEDDRYPGPNYSYETFVVRKGIHIFDGKTALKYARSRKSSSDYDRARRQQDLVLAMQKKLESMGWAENAQKIRQFYDLFRRKVNTDIGLTEIMALGKIAMDIDFADITSFVLNDDPSQPGGLLYTPAKEFYNGQFVLLPDDIEDTRTFMQLILSNPDIHQEDTQIVILNGSGREGLAGTLAARIRQLGFHV